MLFPKFANNIVFRFGFIDILERGEVQSMKQIFQC